MAPLKSSVIYDIKHRKPGKISAMPNILKISRKNKIGNNQWDRKPTLIFNLKPMMIKKKS